MKSINITVMMLVICFGCRSAQSNENQTTLKQIDEPIVDGGGETDDQDISFECEGGEKLILSAGSLDAMPTQADLHEITGYSVVGDFERFKNAEETMRLGICFGEDGSLELKQIIALRVFAGVEIYSPDQSVRWEISGLEDAVFGDYSNLEILAQNADSGEYGYAIKGYVLNGQHFMVYQYAQFTETGIEPTSVYTNIGRLIENDPFSELLCSIGDMEFQASFNLGDAEFNATMCTYMGGGETMGYDIVKLTVKDSRIEALTGSDTFILENESLKQALVDESFMYRWNHHNACDSFQLTISGQNLESSLVFAATASPMAGCGVSVGQAPQRDLLSDEYWGKTAYVIIENGEASPVMYEEFSNPFVNF